MRRTAGKTRRSDSSSSKPGPGSFLVPAQAGTQGVEEAAGGPSPGSLASRLRGTGDFPRLPAFAEVTGGYFPVLANSADCSLTTWFTTSV